LQGKLEEKPKNTKLSNQLQNPTDKDNIDTLNPQIHDRSFFWLVTSTSEKKVAGS
jgi:hypothetical protein